MQKSGKDQQKQHGHGRSGGDDGWIWGLHPVLAALANPSRDTIQKILVTADRAAQIESALGKRRGISVEILEGAQIAKRLPSGAVHQGCALKAPVLEGDDLEALITPREGVIVVLDQITDPQNVGAIFRSAAAFGARGIVMQDRHSPDAAGALAKTSAGAIETLPFARVVNLSRALDQIKDAGFQVVGLAGESDADLSDVIDGGPVALVLGSEGEGLRRLVSERCDRLARIPMPGGFESLNVSNAAAIALYEAAGRKRG